MIVVLLFLSAYCVFLLVLHAGWQRAIRDRKSPSVPFYPMISVIVPFRNERGNLPRILDDLRQQEYSNYEVILVDDHSTDDSRTVAEKNRFANVSIIHNLSTGKKSALASGISAAKGEILATTDADCRMGKHWLESIRASFTDLKTKLVFGAVAIGSQSGLFSALQSVEFASLIGTGAATCALDAPTMCNGANLAFRRETFYAVDGYRGNEHIASGDDEFLMRKILETFPRSVKFIPFNNAVVITRPSNSPRSFFHQRIRWAGKWKSNTSTVAVLLAFFILSMQVAVVAGIASLFLTLNYSVVILLFIKLMLEGTFINRICKFCRIRMSWSAFAFLQILYPFYVLVVGIASNFITPVWKDRKI